MTVMFDAFSITVHDRCLFYPVSGNRKLFCNPQILHTTEPQNQSCEQAVPLLKGLVDLMSHKHCPIFPKLVAISVLAHRANLLAPYSALPLLLGLGPLFTLLASGLNIWPAGIQFSSYAFAPLVTAGPSPPETDTWSAGSTRLDPPEDFFARSPDLPAADGPRRFCGK